MSLFLDFPCSHPHEARAILARWCTVEPICALVTSENCVSFYIEEGVHLEGCKIVRASNATDISWHPTAKSIVCGWEDGHISVWGLSTTSGNLTSLTSTCIFATDSKRGRTPIRVISWNPIATRLVSGDASGLILIWKVSEF